MRNIKLAGFFAGGMAVSAAALMVATEITAWRFHWHPSLGRPWAFWDAIPLYRPWDILRWLSWWPATNEVRLGLIAGGITAALPIIGGICFVEYY